VEWTVNSFVSIGIERVGSEELEDRKAVFYVCYLHLEKILKKVFTTYQSQNYIINLNYPSLICIGYE